MVRIKGDYERRKSDDRFKDYDEQLQTYSSDNDKKQFVILIIGVIVCLSMMAYSLFMELQKPVELKYEPGLNISYSPESSLYIIEYTNPSDDTTSANIQIKTIILDTINMATNYDYTTNKFPLNVTYKPYDKNIQYYIFITLNKNTGNYTYTYVNVPSSDDAIYKNNPIKGFKL